MGGARPKMPESVTKTIFQGLGGSWSGQLSTPSIRPNHSAHEKKTWTHFLLDRELFEGHFVEQRHARTARNLGELETSVRVHVGERTVRRIGLSWTEGEDDHCGRLKEEKADVQYPACTSELRYGSYQPPLCALSAFRPPDHRLRY
jgi:hypothetical protein